LQEALLVVVATAYVFKLISVVCEVRVPIVGIRWGVIFCIAKTP